MTAKTTDTTNTAGLAAPHPARLTERQVGEARTQITIDPTVLQQVN